LQNITNCLEAVTRICRNAPRFPTKAESNFVVLSTALLETNGCSNTVGMGHEALDISTQVMIRIRICADACMMHYLCYCRSRDESEGNRETGREDAQRFCRWNHEEMSSAQDRHAGVNWVQERMIKRTELLDGEVAF
jgi:hypothetical protein